MPSDPDVDITPSTSPPPPSTPPVPDVPPAPLQPTEPRRLHWMSLLFETMRHGRNFLLPGVVVLFLAKGESWELWLPAIFVVVMAYELIGYFTLRYTLAADELIVRKGLIFRNERHVRYSRIQNIDLIQNFLHRIFGVAEARIETAGGTEPEAVLRVLSLDAVRTLRERVFAHDGRAETDGQPDVTRTGGSELLLRIPMGDLMRLGLLSNRGMVIVGIALAAAWEWDLFDKLDIDLKKAYTDYASTLDTTMTVVAIAGSVVGALIFLRVLSMIWVVLRFYGYTLKRQGNDLQVSCGLLTRVSATVPRRRVQLISVHRTLFQRWLGLASIRIETAGGGGSDDEDASQTISRRWFVPIVHIEDVQRIIGELRPGFEIEEADIDWQPLAPRAPRRMLRRSIIVGLILTAIPTAIWWPWGALAGVVILPLAIIHAIHAARITNWARFDGGMLYRSGVWTRKISATFFDKMQVISIERSPFDRRWKMSTLSVDTAASGPAEHAIHVRFLEPEVARTEFETLTAATQHAAFAV